MYQGPYSENTAAFKALTDYAEYKRIPVDDMMYEIPVIDPLSTNDQRQLLTEIQIKVKRREIDTRCLV